MKNSIRIAVGEELPFLQYLAAVRLVDSAYRWKPSWDDQGLAELARVIADSRHGILIYVGNQGARALTIIRRRFVRPMLPLVHIGAPPIPTVPEGQARFSMGAMGLSGRTRAIHDSQSARQGYCSMAVPNLFKIASFFADMEHSQIRLGERLAVFRRFGWRESLRAKEEILHKTGHAGKECLRDLCEFAAGSARETLSEFIDELREKDDPRVRGALAVLHSITRAWFPPPRQLGQQKRTRYFRDLGRELGFISKAQML